jgi:predicted DNA-binding transcriptional regulator AlpA
MRRNNICSSSFFEITHRDKPSASGQLLSVAEASARLGISKSWLNKSRVHGTGPLATMIGRRVLYDMRDLEVWLNTKKRRSTSDLGG